MKTELLAAKQFVEDNIVVLCQELVELDETGLYGNGKLQELRQMCSVFASTSAQALAKGMVEIAAVRLIAKKL